MLVAMIGAAAAFIAVSCTMLWMAGLRGSPAEARLGRLAHGARRVSVDAPFSARVMIPVVDNVTNAFMHIMPHTFVQRISTNLQAAGNPMTTAGFFAVLLITSVFFPLALIAFLAMTGTTVNALPIVLTLVFAGIGFMIPIFVLQMAVSSRKSAIWKHLPDAFDLITVSVEAGLGLDAALRQVSEKLRGPLSDEIAQVLREVGMGRARREALEDMAVRCQVRELETFVHAVVQAEQLGTSLGRVLRAQALSLRVRRRQRAQELARRAPVKMVFPLVFLIMPTFFIITLGPVAVRFFNYVND
jgi:tight adherence protein C